MRQLFKKKIFWLSVALDTTENHTNHYEFYSSLICFSSIDMGVSKRVGEGNKPDFKKLDNMGVLIVAY